MHRKECEAHIVTKALPWASQDTVAFRLLDLYRRLYFPSPGIILSLSLPPLSHTRTRSLFHRTHSQNLFFSFALPQSRFVSSTSLITLSSRFILLSAPGGLRRGTLGITPSSPSLPFPYHASGPSDKERGQTVWRRGMGGREGRGGEGGGV